MKKKNIFILYGSTGNLAINKILPALSVILSENDEDFGILALGRRNFDTEKYLQYVKTINPDFEQEKFKKVLGYVNIDISDEHDYLILKNMLKDLTGVNTKIVHYLALAPELVLKVAKNLSESGIVTKDSLRHRIIFEKPFGFNLKSAKTLKKHLWKYFSEEQIYRIDHYLGKDIINQIYNIRFENKITKKLFEEEKIKSIKIFALEKDGILTRGEYYDKAGAISDFVQNHLLQIVSLVLMEKPNCYACDDLINAKVNALKKIVLSKECCAFGQYFGYLSEKNVSRKSQTETFVAITLLSKNKKYKNLKINLITGKKTDERKNGLIVEFENNNVLHFDFVLGKIDLIMNGKVKHIHQSDNQLPYVKLIKEAFEGDKRFFVRYNEIEEAWKIADKIQKKKENIFIYANNNDIKQNLHEKNMEVFDDLL